MGPRGREIGWVSCGTQSLAAMEPLGAVCILIPHARVRHGVKSSGPLALEFRLWVGGYLVFPGEISVLGVLHLVQNGSGSISILWGFSAAVVLAMDGQVAVVYMGRWTGIKGSLEADRRELPADPRGRPLTLTDLKAWRWCWWEIYLISTGSKDQTPCHSDGAWNPGKDNWGSQLTRRTWSSLSIAPSRAAVAGTPGILRYLGPLGDREVSIIKE